jgi:hypothetical protein
MPEVREAAARLVRSGHVVATRRGAIVDPRAPGGPIRLGRPQSIGAAGGTGAE